MREIKFRAWEKSFQEIIPVDNMDFSHRLINCDSAWRFFDEVELMQYTGLKTDTGKEVYEGDIIVIPNLIGKIHNHVDTVVFDNGTFHLKTCNDIIVCQELMDEGVSVIGNIYENPDLLEQ